jgi:CHAT domain-containing protein
VEGDNHPRTAKALDNLGQWWQEQGTYAAAQSYFEGALAVRRQVLGERHPETALSFHHLGMALMAKGDLAGARSRLEQAGAIQRNLAQDVLGTLSEAEALAFGETTQYSRDPLLSVLRHLPATTPETAYTLAWDTRALASRAMATRRHRTAEYPEARDLWEQLRATRADLAKLAFGPPPPSAKAKARQEQEARLTLRKEQLERELARASTRFRREQQVQGTRFADLALQLPPAAAVLDVIQMTLWEPPAEGKGQFHRTRHYEAFVLRKTATSPGYRVAWVHLGPAEPIDQAARAWRQDLLRSGGIVEGAPVPATAEGPERRLRRLVWEPVETHLAGCTTVVVIPDAALTGLPWAALPGQKPDSYLLEDYALGTASHGQQLYDLLSQEPPRGDKLLLVGGVRYDPAPGRDRPPAVGETPNRWPYLKGTLAEVERIEALWQGGDRVVLLQGEAARESTLREQLPRARYVHLATHGFFADPQVPSAFRHDVTRERLVVEGFELTGARSTVSGRNPLLLSGVVLAGANGPSRRDALGSTVGDDGILTGEEVAELDLRATELVVLSACETGRGEVAGGEGVFGLQRAFGLAGARAVVASLWKVEDRATQVLMGEFYRNLWENQLGKLEALRRAQLTMLAHYDRGHGTLRGAGGRRSVGAAELAKARQEKKAAPPFYWAGFVLAGDWR